MSSDNEHCANLRKRFPEFKAGTYKIPIKIGDKPIKSSHNQSCAKDDVEK
jgi:hypothetical protein